MDPATRRRLVSLIVEPLVHPVGKGWHDQKGINRVRVEWAWL
ncbi:hypothetical protein StoSoilB5_19010 [Arthrobacter sp. StoSoilB5]|nr:hypothetical protein StoSoilB5_19010 [Arthrobacter sp. StoSoilB5]